VLVWDGQQLPQLRLVARPDHTDATTQAAFSADGQALATMDGPFSLQGRR
jgi:hypothetical protein